MLFLTRFFMLKADLVGMNLSGPSIRWVKVWAEEKRLSILLPDQFFYTANNPCAHIFLSHYFSIPATFKAHGLWLPEFPNQHVKVHWHDSWFLAEETERKVYVNRFALRLILFLILFSMNWQNDKFALARVTQRNCPQTGNLGSQSYTIIS